MTEQLQDQTLTCVERDCGTTFTFTVGEQKFYSERQYTPPKRCKTCRYRKKAMNAGGGGPPRSATPQERPPMVPETPSGRGGDRGRRGGNNRDDGGKRGRRDHDDRW